MITESIMNMFLFIPRVIIDMIPVTTIDLPNSVTGVATQLLDGVGYVFPILGLMPILLNSILLDIFKVTWALLIRIKSFIPTMGA